MHDVRPTTLPAVLVLAAASVASLAADWPSFRGPNRDGISKETGVLERWPEQGPRVLFRVPLGQGFSAISAVGGRLYTMYAEGADEFAACLDAGTGAVVWRRRVDEKWDDDMGHGPRSTPTVDGDLVYVLSGSGRLLALHARDGKAAWRRDLQVDYEAKPPKWGASTSPLVEGKLLLVDVGGRGGSSIVAFDKTTGDEVWKSQSDKPGYSAPIAITVGGVRQALFFTGTALVALDPANGSLLWKRSWKTSYDVNAATPVFVPPDKLFVSSGYDVGSTLFTLTVAEGKVEPREVWSSREMKNKFSSSVLHDGHLYGFDDSTLKCIDVKTGETTWRQRGLGFGSLIYADGHLIVLGDAGQLVLVEAAPDAYREQARMQVFQGKTWTLPTLSDGKLYLRDEKELVALDVSGRPAPEPAATTPAR